MFFRRPTGDGRKRRSSKRRRTAIAFIALLAVAGAGVKADVTAYNAVVDLSAAADTFTVRHHHNWSMKRRQAFLEWQSRPAGKVLSRTPTPALTWLGVTNDSRYVIGLSNIKLDNAHQLVVYTHDGGLLLQRHITPHVACLMPAAYRELERKHAMQMRALRQFAWVNAETVYVDFFRPDAPRVLGRSLRDELIDNTCPHPWLGRATETVSNFVQWFDEANPSPTIIERAGKPVAVRLRDPDGRQVEVPFAPNALGF